MGFVWIDAFPFLLWNSGRHWSLPDCWRSQVHMGFITPSMKHTIIARKKFQCACHIMSLSAQPHRLALALAFGAARWAAPSSPDGYLFHQPPSLCPWFTSPQDSLQYSCCKAVPANNFAKWLLSKSWTVQTDRLLHLQQLLAKRHFPFWFHLLAAPEPSCQKDDLIHQ